MITAVGLLLLSFVISNGVFLYARIKADRIKQTLLKNTPDATALAIGRWATIYWKQPGEDHVPNLFAWARYLPNPWKIPRGSVDFLGGYGWCNQLVAAIQWIFRHDDRVQVQQVNITTPDSAHSAIAVRIEGSDWIYLDPFYGYAFADPETGKLLWLKKLTEKLHNGTPLEDMAVLLAPGHETLLINMANLVSYGFDNELTIINRLIHLDHETGRFTLGKLDQSSDDVFDEAIQNGLTPMFSFVGARYYTGLIVRHTFVPEEVPNGVEIRFIFTKPPLPNPILPVSNIEPHFLDQKTLVYFLQPGEISLELDYRSFPNGQFYEIDRYEVIAM